MTKKKTKEKTLVLLDAHAIIHRAYHALPDFSTSKGEPTGGLYGVASMLMKIIADLKPDYIAACYDLPEPTFRHEAYEGYKATRAKADEALIAQIDRSRDIFRAFGIPVYEAPGFEADDILGTIAEKMKGKPVRIIIASGDMDTLQLVSGKDVCVYTLRKGMSDIVLYDEKAVIERFGFPPRLLPDFKALAGDSSDNIPGVAGIGAKTATALIEAFGPIEDIYAALEKSEEEFEKRGFKKRVVSLLRDGKEEAFFSKTLATIRTDANIRFRLPDTPWRESFNPKQAEKLFFELEFRSLVPRLRALFGAGEEDGAGQEKKKRPPEREVKEIALAVWVLRSDIVSPGYDDVVQYAGTDDWEKAKKKILGDIKKEGLEKVYYHIELPIMDIVERAEKTGIKIDIPYIKKLSREYHAKLRAHEKKIWSLAGREFNINSPKQLAEVLFDEMKIAGKNMKKTPTGARSTRESELLKISDEEIVAEVLRYRELQKLLSTYIDVLPKLADGNGRVHTTLNQAGTTTGRFSSSNPNLQNIPARDGFGVAVRNAFVAEKGYALVDFDYSQIEMRVLAALSGDETLIGVFRAGGDVHASVAARVFGVSERDVTKDMRRKAKVINFGIVYGMGVNALRANLGGTLQEARAFYRGYFEKFPKIAAYFENVKKEAARKGYTETLFGRRRHFEGLRSPLPHVRAAAERQAGNAPIQGTAADIIKIAMKKADDALKREKITGARLLLQIHDELLFEVGEADVPRVRDVVRPVMEGAVDLPVPLSVNVSSGARWGDIH